MFPRRCDVAGDALRTHCRPLIGLGRFALELTDDAAIIFAE